MTMACLTRYDRLVVKVCLAATCKNTSVSRMGRCPGRTALQTLSCFLRVMCRPKNFAVRITFSGSSCVSLLSWQLARADAVAVSSRPRLWPEGGCQISTSWWTRTAGSNSADGVPASLLPLSPGNQHESNLIFRYVSCTICRVRWMQLRPPQPGETSGANW